MTTFRAFGYAPQENGIYKKRLHLVEGATPEEAVATLKKGGVRVDFDLCPAVPEAMNDMSFGTAMDLLINFYVFVRRQPWPEDMYICHRIYHSDGHGPTIEQHGGDAGPPRLGPPYTLWRPAVEDLLAQDWALWHGEQHPPFCGHPDEEGLPCIQNPIEGLCVIHGEPLTS